MRRMSDVVNRFGGPKSKSRSWFSKCIIMIAVLTDYDRSHRTRKAIYFKSLEGEIAELRRQNAALLKGTLIRHLSSRTLFLTQSG
jgi:hypothetical protein